MTKQMYPCLWFNGQAKAAADFYCTIFPNSKIINDSGMVVNFELNGQFFMGLNGGDNFKFILAGSSNHIGRTNVKSRKRAKSCSSVYENEKI
jgi:predicted 3-demethylubiquinone-9 3-methyltransferase (glyoxalase superfamily)